MTSDFDQATPGPPHSSEPGVPFPLRDNGPPGPTNRHARKAVRERSPWRFLPRAVITFLVLDVVTYLVVYVVIVSALSPIIIEMSPAMQTGTRIGLSIIRLGFVGYYTARSIRRRYGLATRAACLPTIGYGALLGAGWQLALILLTNDGASLEAMALSNLTIIPEWLIFAGLGALMVTPGPSGSVRAKEMTRIMNRELRDSGQAQAEYVGIIAVVVAIILALILGISPVGQMIAGKLCDAFGASCGSDVSAEPDGVKPPPTTPCAMNSERDYAKVNGTVVVDLMRGEDFTKETMSDGTFRVTTGSAVGVGYSLDAVNAKADVTIGDDGKSGGINASAGIMVSATGGQTAEFDSEEAADQYVSYVKRQAGVGFAADVLSPAILGSPFGKRFLGDLVETGIGWFNGEGKYEPPRPIEMYAEGEVSLTGKAKASLELFNLGASAEAGYAQAIGASFNTETGDSTIYFNMGVNGKAELDASGLVKGAKTGVQGDAAVVASVTLSDNGQPLAMKYTIDATGGPYGALNEMFGTGVNTSASTQNGSRFELSFDLTDAEQAGSAKDLSDLVVGGVFDPSNLLDSNKVMSNILNLREIFDNSEVTMQAITSSSNKIVDVDLGAELAGIGVGLGGSYGVDSTKISDSRYYAGGNAGWRTWAACS